MRFLYNSTSREAEDEDEEKPDEHQKEQNKMGQRKRQDYLPLRSDRVFVALPTLPNHFLSGGGGRFRSSGVSFVMES